MLKKHELPTRPREEHTLKLLLATWFYRLALVLMLTAGIYKWRALPMALDSSEGMVTLAVYLGLLFVLQETYRACAIGQARVLDLVMSQSLTNIISAGMVYIGVALYVHNFVNPLCLLMILVCQVLFGVLWTIVANYIYFKYRRPPRTALIYRSEEDLAMLRMSPDFEAKYDVQVMICAPKDDVKTVCAKLDGCEAVFTVAIEASITNEIAKYCLARNIKGYFTPSLGHIIMAGAKHQTQFSIPVLRTERAGGHSEYRFFKRGFDICAALIGIVVASPIMLLTALAIWLEDHGPVFYRQVRLTKNGRTFQILKFRSMSVNAEQDGIARLAGENDSRITKVGKTIRACRIDELPQLFNILKGEMSVVGPRPERPEIAVQYEEQLPEFALRLQVKAGLTGLAQVYGRYNTEPFNKLQMDLMYINEMSLLKDLQLILATIKILFLKESTQGIGKEQETALKTDKKAKSA